MSLIKLIEDYNLNEFTMLAMQPKKELISDSTNISMPADKLNMRTKALTMPRVGNSGLSER